MPLSEQIEQLRLESAQIRESAHHSEKAADRLSRLAYLCLAIAIVLAVIAVALQFQVSTRNKQIDRNRETAEQARIASDQARIASETATAILQAAIASGQQSQPETESAIQAIKRIEERLNQLFPPEATPTPTTR